MYDYAGNNPARYIGPNGSEDKKIEWIMKNVPEQYRDKAIKSWEENRTIPGGTLTAKELAAILFNETRSLSGEKIKQARKEVAHSIINADKKWKEKRSTYAKTAAKEAKVPEVESYIYEACLEAAIEAVKEDEEGIDPTNNNLQEDSKKYTDFA
ncbi:MAG: hypothetical protein PUC37_08380 [Spirochaetales bacterium]|nr:hypothetical protein [Spirochaetales bacterium]